MVSYVKFIVVFALSALTVGGVAAQTPSYIGAYKYLSYRCGGNYGPFSSAEEAVAVAAAAEYPSTCGVPAVTSSEWSTSSHAVLVCGGSPSPSYVLGVESSNYGRFRTEYKYGDQCQFSSADSIFVYRWRPVCTQYQRYMADIDRCDDVASVSPNDAPAGNPKNNGKVCPDCSRGDPVNPVNGNNWRNDTDYAAPIALGGLRFVRTYNSSPFNPDADTVRSNGARWTNTFDRSLKTVTLPVSGATVQCYRRIRNNAMFCEGPATVAAGQDVAAVRPDGKVYNFKWNGAGWTPEADTGARLDALYQADGTTLDGWTLALANDDAERYDNAGHLLSITNLAGTAQQLTYSDGLSNDSAQGRWPQQAPVCGHVQQGALLPAGRLLCVTDHWGRQLQFEYDAKGRIAKMIDPAGQEYGYGYDGPSAGCAAYSATNRACNADNLTSVTFPDGKQKTYWYNESSRINNGAACTQTVSIGAGYGHLLHALTAMSDEDGGRFVTWSYDCMGRTTANELAGSVAKVSFTYGTPDSSNGDRSTTVSTYYGDPAAPQVDATVYNFKLVGEVGKNSSLAQNCAHCGDVAARTFDAHGNVATSKDWAGMLTTYSYDLSRNLETGRVEASGTALARTITTEWHPQLRLPSRIAQPKRITTFAHDGHGNLMSRTVQATSDLTGAQAFNAVAVGGAQTWRYTYNDQGQMLTAKGPRTDVNDVTSYSYDTAGNLASVSNAAGQVTTLSGYDAHGHVGRITDPNGLATDLSYTARGWLAASAVGGESTSYEYDGAGQLTRVSLPDGSSVSYTYDAAHRLTAMTDSLGNSVNYTLDLLGNRVAEQVRDGDGLLARQVTRVYDVLNRLKQITGAQQ
jgi:YD repeat-containing protein